MAKIYEGLYGSDFLTKEYDHVVFIQNRPQSAKDETDSQKLLLAKYHRDIETLVGSNAFVANSGNKITIDAGNSRYLADGIWCVDGVFFKFEDFVIVLDTQTNEIDDPITYPLSTDGIFYLKISIDTIKYTDDSSIALDDPVTPKYIETSERKKVSAKVIFNEDPLTDVTVNGEIVTYYRQIGTFTVSGPTITNTSVDFYSGTSLFTEYDAALKDLFDNGLLDNAEVLTVVTDDFPEYPQVLGLSIDNGSISEAGTFADPYSLPDTGIARLSWKNMRDQVIELTANVSTSDTVVNVNDTSLFPSSGSAYFADNDDLFNYTGKTSTSFTGVTSIDTAHLAGTEIKSHAGSGHIYKLADNTSDWIAKKYWKSTRSYLVYILIAARTGTVSENPKVSTLTDNATYNSGSTTINVDSTIGFPASGTAYFNNDGDDFTYTGTTATSFTGVTGITGSHIGPTRISLDPMGAWYKIADTQDNFIEIDLPKGIKIAFWVGAKIREIEDSALTNIPNFNFDLY